MTMDINYTVSLDLHAVAIVELKNASYMRGGEVRVCISISTPDVECPIAFNISVSIHFKNSMYEALGCQLFLSDILSRILSMSISACAKHQCELFSPFEDDVNGTITIELERTEIMQNSIIFGNRSAVIETGRDYA